MKTRIIIIGLVALMFTGCATRRQAVEMQLEIARIRHENKQLMAALEEIKSLQAKQNGDTKKLAADLGLGLAQIEEKMQLVEARLSDAGSQINTAVNKMDTRAGRSGETVSADTTSNKAEVDQMKVYRLAYEDVTKGNYQLAISGFEEYLNQYPKSALADNAVYWIGECFYSLKDYAKSQVWYLRLMDDYPKSEHLASAKLKYGKSLFNQRYKTKAKQYFQDVVKEFPGSEEANQAAEMLSRY